MKGRVYIILTIGIYVILKSISRRGKPYNYLQGSKNDINGVYIYTYGDDLCSQNEVKLRIVIVLHLSSVYNEDLRGVILFKSEGEETRRRVEITRKLDQPFDLTKLQICSGCYE